MKQLDSAQASVTIVSMTLSDSIRKAIETSGMSRYELSKRSGVDEAALSRFVRGIMALKTDTLDKIAGPLGLRLVVKRPSKRKGR